MAIPTFYSTDEGINEYGDYGSYNPNAEVELISEFIRASSTLVTYTGFS